MPCATLDIARQIDVLSAQADPALYQCQGCTRRCQARERRVLGTLVFVEAAHSM